MNQPLHSLKLTAKAPENRPNPKGKRESIPNQSFSAAFAASFREGRLQGCTGWWGIRNPEYHDNHWFPSSVADLWLQHSAKVPSGVERAGAWPTNEVMFYLCVFYRVYHYMYNTCMYYI